MDESTKLLFQGLKEDIAELRADVKILLAFKWQIIGGSMALSGIVSVVVTVILETLKN